ncbi:MAG: ammonium transporter [Proteobacteria bacterium]|nr:ammonium transporter [Pseudomonadota bacterium]
MNIPVRVRIFLALLALPGLGLAQEAGLAPQSAIVAADAVWITVATALVLLMTLPGLAFFYAGLVRAKNVLSVLFQCTVVICVMSILWMLVGYSISFGDGGGANAWWGGLGKFALMGVDKSSAVGTLPELVFIIFQMSFAFVTPALIVGGFAERMKFSSILIFLVAWEILVYFPTCHWIWGGGWLADIGFIDFAGGAVVHINAGIAALVAAVMVGRRAGFGKLPMLPHNLGLTMGGAGLLWVGWYGFNGGSALTAGADAAMAILVTHLCACTAGLVWAGIEWRRQGAPTALGLVTGLVAGLATITPAAGVTGPIGALFVGVCAGFVCYALTAWIKNRLKIDDSLDVFAVHGMGGLLGLILLCFTGLESWGGFGEFEVGRQLLVQLAGIFAILIWSLAFSVLILWLLKKTIGLRVEAQAESTGLDLSTHGEKGYHF